MLSRTLLRRCARLESATAALISGDTAAALSQLDAIKAERLPVRGVDALRAQGFFVQGNAMEARQALLEEIRPMVDRIMDERASRSPAGS